MICSAWRRIGRRCCPRAEFVSPNAPFPCELAPYGRQWFGFEGRDAQMILGEVQTAAAILNGFIDEQLAQARPRMNRRWRWSDSPRAR